MPIWLFLPLLFIRLRARRENTAAKFTYHPSRPPLGPQGPPGPDHRGLLLEPRHERARERGRETKWHVGGGGRAWSITEAMCSSLTPPIKERCWFSQICAWRWRSDFSDEGCMLHKRTVGSCTYQFEPVPNGPQESQSRRAAFSTHEELIWLHCGYAAFRSFHTSNYFWLYLKNVFIMNNKQDNWLTGRKKSRRKHQYDVTYFSV